MRITFAKADMRGSGFHPPKSYDVKVDGERVGSITECRDGPFGVGIGWRWVVRSDELGIPWKNTAAEKIPPVPTLDEARARVKSHLLSVLKPEGK